MDPFDSLARTLTDSLQLTQPPVAVCFADAIPAGIKLYSGRGPGRLPRLAGSRQSECLLQYRVITDLCSIGVYTHNLETTPAQQQDLGDALKIFADLGYVRHQDLPLIPVLNRKPKAVIYGPLAEVPLPPDVVLMFVRADQAHDSFWRLLNNLKEICRRPRRDGPLAPSCLRRSTRAVPPRASLLWDSNTH